MSKYGTISRALVIVRLSCHIWCMKAPLSLALLRLHFCCRCEWVVALQGSRTTMRLSNPYCDGQYWSFLDQQTHTGRFHTHPSVGRDDKVQD